MEQHQQPPLPQRTVLAAINAADNVVNTVSNAYASLRTKAMTAKGPAAIIRVPFKLTDRPRQAFWNLYQHTAQRAWDMKASARPQG